VNSDGQINSGDLLHFVHNVMRTEIGDSNLDGAFALNDLRIEEFEDDVVGNSTWAEGDWNCDQESTTADIVWAFMVSPRPAAAIPLNSQLIHDAALRFALESAHSSVLDQGQRTRELEAAHHDHRINQMHVRSPTLKKATFQPRNLSIDTLFIGTNRPGTSEAATASESDCSLEKELDCDLSNSPPRNS
jgi:hypothetical protein